MFLGQDRKQLREVYFQSWHKFKHHLPLEPMESLIAELIQKHPEYHDFFNPSKDNINKEFTPEMGQTNPFLHLGMHISIQEQLATQRPAEMNTLYQSLCAKLGDTHDAEHRIMDCLGEMLWTAQHNNQQPDEAGYIECLKKLL